MTNKFLQVFSYTKVTLIHSFFSFLRFFWGFICCWTPLTAPLLAGWMNHYMLHSAVYVWVKRSTLENLKNFYIAPEYAALSRWPRWSDGYSKTAESRVSNWFIRLIFTHSLSFLRSIGCQYRSGLLSLFNTWLLTLPFALVWLWMWWAGWNNTFSRGYEEEGLAPLTFLFSSFGFCIVMLYVPLAQARQAIHGTLASFFDFRVIRIITRHVRFRLFILSTFYALGCLGLIGGTKIFPTMFDKVYHVNLEDIEAVKKAASAHFFFVILCFYCGLLFVKRMNARVYAIGVLKALQAKALTPVDLSQLERTLLVDTLSFPIKKVKKAKPRWLRFMVCPLRKLSTFILVVLTLAVWGGVAFSFYFGQFMNLSHIDWLNMPMIQMPYIRVPEIHGG